jgi:hypothetical protein
MLASVLILTVIIGFATWELEQVYSRAPDAEYAKVYSLAGDIGQIAVKNLLANRSNSGIMPNVVNASKWPELGTFMGGMILPPYAYEANLSNSGLTKITGNGGCDSKQNVASARRIVYIDNAVGVLLIKVCV